MHGEDAVVAGGQGGVDRRLEPALAPGLDLARDPAPALGTAEMALQAIELAAGLDLARRRLDHRQELLGRQLVDQLRLALGEPGGVQPRVQFGIGLTRSGCGGSIA